MRNVQGVEFHVGSREEFFPEFAADFPYIASRAELDKYAGGLAPWHWHRPVELFYMESGLLEYETLGGRVLFPAGSGGLVNANVLHMTRVLGQTEENIQLLHIFDVSLLAGEQGSRIEQKYITPVTADSQIEILPLFPEDKEQQQVLNLIREAFRIPAGQFGYEIRLRQALSEIWLRLFEQARPILAKGGEPQKRNGQIKQMMIYVREHYSEKISISELAAAAYLSERECFRVFHDCLHMTPVEYIKSYRLQEACRQLAREQKPVTAVSHACGLGSSSYFGKVFREYMGCTPTQYRAKWQDCDRQGQ